jgi:tetratricopeptide (TPR) repeat protein
MNKILPLLFLFPCLLFGQHKKSDSLFTFLKADKEDTNKVIHLNQLSNELIYFNIDTSIILSNQALSLAEKKQWERGVLTSLLQIGLLYYYKGDYHKALEIDLRGLQIAEKINNKNSIAKVYGNIGTIYNSQADYPKALDYYFKSLKLAEELGNENLQTNALANIGLVYSNLSDSPKALDYFFKALKKAELLGNKNAASLILGNIGAVYTAQGDYPRALETYLKTLKIAQGIKNKNTIAFVSGNIGSVYTLKADSALAKKNTSLAMTELYPKALESYFKALGMYELLGDKNGIAINLGNIGAVYTATGRYSSAYLYLHRVLSIDDSMGTMNYKKDHYKNLSDLYEKSTISLPDTTGKKTISKEQMRILALYYFKKYIELRDTIFSGENKKQFVRKEMTFQFEKKEAVTKAIQDKKDALAKEELKRKEQQRNYFILGFAIVAFLAVFILRSYRQKRKDNIIITQQKNIVDEKQKEILDSIHYAKRIQNALLPSEKYIERTLTNLKKD